MDFLTQQFVAAAKWLRDELSRLQNSIDAIRDEYKREHEEHRNQSPQPVVVEAELQIPEAIERDHGTRDDRAHRQQIWLTVGTWLAFGAAAIYAAIAAYQLGETKKVVQQATRAAKAAEDANTAAGNRFREDQRPYVWLKAGYVGQIEFIPKKGANQTAGQIVWTFQYINYGRSPAHEVFFDSKSMSLGVNNRFRESFGFSEAKRRNIATPLAPTEENFATIISNPGVSPSDYAIWQWTIASAFVRLSNTWTHPVAGHTKRESALLNSPTVPSGTAKAITYISIRGSPE